MWVVFAMQVINWQKPKIHRYSLEFSQVLLKFFGGLKND